VSAVDSPPVDPAPSPTPVPRRTFSQSLVATVIAAFAAAVPLVTGVIAFLNPLRPSVKAKLRPGGADDKGFFKVSSVANLEEGVPQSFTILADRKDAWNRYPSEPVGTVFLCKKGDGVVALNSRCPHAGCDVDYQPSKSGFVCPCHDSLFGLEGGRTGASPSPRDLDQLEVEKRGEEVWVKFQNFKTGRPDKEAV
jgi:menaquinol-cytochrome c reductase iron-sulfur subunit